MSKHYVKTRIEAEKVGQKIAGHAIGEYGFCVEILDQIRTPLQNRALHKYFHMLADALNEAGLEIHMEFLGKTLEVPWSKDSVKERIWLPAMEAQTGKVHTSDLVRREVSMIYEVLSRYFTGKHGIYVPFPDEESWAERRIA